MRLKKHSNNETVEVGIHLAVGADMRLRLTTRGDHDEANFSFPPSKVNKNGYKRTMGRYKVHFKITAWQWVQDTAFVFPEMGMLEHSLQKCADAPMHQAAQGTTQQAAPQVTQQHHDIFSEVFGADMFVP